MPQSRGPGGRTSLQVSDFAAAALGQPTDAQEIDVNKKKHETNTARWRRFPLIRYSAWLEISAPVSAGLYVLLSALAQLLPDLLPRLSSQFGRSVRTYLIHCPRRQKSPSCQN